VPNLVSPERPPPPIALIQALAAAVLPVLAVPVATSISSAVVGLLSF
jgi:hypothetical protein